MCLKCQLFITVQRSYDLIILYRIIVNEDFKINLREQLLLMSLFDFLTMLSVTQSIRRVELVWFMSRVCFSNGD